MRSLSPAHSRCLVVAVMLRAGVGRAGVRKPGGPEQLPTASAPAEAQPWAKETLTGTLLPGVRNGTQPRSPQSRCLLPSAR